MRSMTLNLLQHEHCELIIDTKFDTGSSKKSKLETKLIVITQKYY